MVGNFVTVFIALLRSVNVGGTGRLPMSDLKKICEDAGFAKVRTYIASGNVLFESNHSESKLKAALEKRLQAYAKRAIPVLIRTAAEMSAIAKANPFKKTDPARTVAIFLDHAPPKDTLDTVKGQSNEEIISIIADLWKNHNAEHRVMVTERKFHYEHLRI